MVEMGLVVSVRPLPVVVAVQVALYIFSIETVTSIMVLCQELVVLAALGAAISYRFVALPVAMAA